MKPGQIQFILFCENEDCPVKPCTDATTSSKAIKEIESMKMGMLKDDRARIR